MLKNETDNKKSNILNNFNCNDDKCEQPVFASNLSSVIDELPLVIKKRGLRPTVANRTPRDFFFIRILGEGAFSTVNNYFLFNKQFLNMFYYMMHTFSLNFKTTFIINFLKN